MDHYENIIHDRKIVLCPTTKDWSVPQLLQECPECNNFLLYCCACNNELLDLPRDRRPAKPCHHFNIIFTDGACTNNGRPGAKAGVGVAYGNDDSSQLSKPITNKVDNFPLRSNQRAELCAAKSGLQFFAEAYTKDPKGEAAAWIVATDSEYVVKGMTEWLPKWKRNNWRTAKGTTPTNLDLFLALDGVVTTLEAENVTIGFWYIPREHNKIADRLAKAAASFDLHSPSPPVQPARQLHTMSVAAPDEPRILLVSLDTASPFDQLYQGILGKLNTVAALDRATKPESALQGLADQPPQAVLVTDGGIAQHRAVYAKLLDYVRGGGRLVLMGDFSSMTRPKDLDRLFQEAGLPWTHGAYQRTTVHCNDTEETSSYTSLPPSYSQKAVFLAGVPGKDAWYLPNDSSHIESRVFYPVPITDQEQTPIALTNIGKGKLGYVGDVNGEEGSDAVVLAMCGLRDNA